jgi:hypothetical protein
MTSFGSLLKMLMSIKVMRLLRYLLLIYQEHFALEQIKGEIMKLKFHFGSNRILQLTFTGKQFPIVRCFLRMRDHEMFIFR